MDDKIEFIPDLYENFNSNLTTTTSSSLATTTTTTSSSLATTTTTSTLSPTISIIDGTTVSTAIDDVPRYVNGPKKGTPFFTSAH